MIVSSKGVVSDSFSSSGLSKSVVWLVLSGFIANDSLGGTLF